MQNNNDECPSKVIYLMIGAIIIFGILGIGLNTMQEQGIFDFEILFIAILAFIIIFLPIVLIFKLFKIIIAFIGKKILNYLIAKGIVVISYKRRYPIRLYIRCTGFKGKINKNLIS